MLAFNPRGVSIYKETIIDIEWATRKLKKACSDDRSGSQHWGADHWKILKRRLASLLAAPTLADMDGVPGNCHQLTADRKESFAVSLWGPYRLVFTPADVPVPRLDDGSIDKARVTRIVVREVTNYHGK